MTNIALCSNRRAEPLLREALAIRSGKRGPANVRTAESQRELGTCLARLGKVDEAEQLLLVSYRVFSGERHGATRHRPGAVVLLAPT